MPYRSSLTALHDSSVRAAAAAIRAVQLASELEHLRRLAKRARHELDTASATLADRVRASEDAPRLRAGLLGGLLLFRRARQSIEQTPDERRREQRDMVEAQAFVQFAEVLTNVTSARERALETEIELVRSVAAKSKKGAPSLSSMYASHEAFECAAKLAASLATTAERAASLAADAHQAAVIAALTGNESFDVNPVFHRAMCEVQRARGEAMIVWASLRSVEHPQGAPCADGLHAALDAVTAGQSAPDQEWRKRVTAFRDRCAVAEHEIKALASSCEQALHAHATIA